jgi:prepilin signal peptidase PulO-like enzyme (type II secretory pathway)
MFTPFYFFAFLLGLIIGSFLNCLIWRIYKNESIGGRSYCPKCRKQIEWYDNIPLLSFILLRGHCRHCHNSISWQYPLVEFITAILFLLTFMKDSVSPDFTILLLRDWFLIITLVIVFVYDFRWQLIPVNVLWVMSVAIFILNLFLGFSYLNIIIYGAIGGAFFLIQYLLTHKKGVGEGDIWLGLFLGICFPSASQLIFLLISSYFLGSIIALSLILGKKTKFKAKIALGPFLVLGTLLTLFFGPVIVEWYLRFGGLL